MAEGLFQTPLLYIVGLSNLHHRRLSPNDWDHRPTSTGRSLSSFTGVLGRVHVLHALDGFLRATRQQVCNGDGVTPHAQNGRFHDPRFIIHPSQTVWVESTGFVLRLSTSGFTASFSGPFTRVNSPPRFTQVRGRLSIRRPRHPIRRCCLGTLVLEPPSMGPAQHAGAQAHGLWTLHRTRTVQRGAAVPPPLLHAAAAVPAALHAHPGSLV